MSKPKSDVSPLRQRLIEELTLRGRSVNTIGNYVRAIAGTDCVFRLRGVGVTVRILIGFFAELRLCGLVVTCHGEA